jgi:hypothetical protein
MHEITPIIGTKLSVVSISILPLNILNKSKSAFRHHMPISNRSLFAPGNDIIRAQRLSSHVQ